MNPQDADLLADLREVAGQSPEPDWAAMETRLLAAFAEQRAADVTAPVEPRRSRPWQWYAAAAVLMMAAAITWYPLDQRPSTPGPKPPEAPRPSAPKLQSGVVESATTAGGSSLSSRGLAGAIVKARPGIAAADAQDDAADRFMDFVALPSASALPDFESGRIVRVEVPLTVLPAYGLDMVPDAAMPGAVAADVLVGQDGLPRAIRLAPTNQ